MINDDNGFRRVEFRRVKDGDTFVGAIITLNVAQERELSEKSIRVHNWDAAELSEPEGAYMRAEFERLLLAAKIITIHPVSRSFERIVCSVFLDDVLFAGIMHEKLLAFRDSMARQ
jgi:hypothetical protein